jgi:hypothetical protein
MSEAGIKPGSGRTDSREMLRACALLLLALPGIAAAQPSSTPRPLEALLPTAAQAGPGWDVVREAPEDPNADPDMRRWGVVATLARHYTRDPGGAAQVCSVELWRFRDEARARAAHAGFSYPDWQIHRAGDVLVMLRGLTLTLGQAPRRGIFDACERLGADVRARAAGG